MSTAANNAVMGELKHVRFVHFSLMLISSVTIYLVLASWTNAPEARKELKAFQRTMHTLSADDSSETSLNFVQIMPKDWRDSRSEELLNIVKEAIPEEFKVSIDKKLEAKILNKSIRLVPVDNRQRAWPDMASSTMKDWRTAAETKKWHIQKILKVDINQDVTQKMRDWIESNTSIETVTGGTWFGEQPVLVDLTPDWDYGNGTQKELKLQLRIGLHFVSSDEQGVMYDAKLGHEDGEFAAMCKTAIEKDIGLPREWFQHEYPLLTDKWNYLEGKTFSDAIESIEEEITARLEERRTNLFGITVHGPDIGYVGPIVILIVLCYMLVCLLNIRSYLKSHTSAEIKGREIAVSPWIGAMSGIPARLLATVGLALVPALAVSCSIWRVLGQEVVSIIFGIGAGGIGLYCVYLGNYISEAWYRRL